MGITKIVESWLAARFDLVSLRSALVRQSGKRLPRSVGWGHTFGSLSLFLFLNQVITGMLLMVYYRPSTEEAFASIKFISTQVHFGNMIRQLHAWGSALMILVVVAHLARTFFAGSYKKPRELTWVSGVLIFIVTLTFGFTGYLLPWNQLAYWATTVGTEVAGSVPLIGDFLRTLLRGGKGVGAETLGRFFTLHVILLPWVLFFLVAGHLLLVRWHNLTQKARVGEEPPVDESNGIPFFPHHVVKEGIVLLALLGTLFTLGTLWPFELGEPADPLSTPQGIKPEWYFLPSYQMLKYWPETTGLVLTVLPFLLLLLWPFLDRNPERAKRKRPLAMATGLLAILLVLGLGLLGHLSESRRTIFGTEYEFDVRGLPHRVESEELGPTLPPIEDRNERAEAHEGEREEEER